MNERGQSLIETMLLGLLLLVPLIWTLTVLSQLHTVALAASAAVRDAGTAAARAAGTADAGVAVRTSVAGALLDHGLEPPAARTRWAFLPRFTRGARVEVAVRYPVRVFRVPFLGVVGPKVWVDARHVARVHPFVSRP